MITPTGCSFVICMWKYNRCTKISVVAFWWTTCMVHFYDHIELNRSVTMHLMVSKTKTAENGNAAALRTIMLPFPVVSTTRSLSDRSHQWMQANSCGTVAGRSRLTEIWRLNFNNAHVCHIFTDRSVSISDQAVALLFRYFRLPISFALMCMEV